MNEKHLSAAIRRFWANVKKSDGCWLWIGQKNETGYGRLWFHDRKWSAHRFSWLIHVARIEEGKRILHRCDVRNCVNPAHLFPGTQLDNVQDCKSKGRFKSNKYELNPRSILTRDSVLKMRQKRSQSGTSFKSLASEFGVSLSAAFSAVNGRTWKNI